jgi:hypothetical protein
VSVCHTCGAPSDADYFDESSIRDAPATGEETLLASYDLHRNYCGLLLYFAQFSDRYASDPSKVGTPGYEWQIRCDGRPRDPYLTFDRIINPWGLSGFPVSLRLDQGSSVEFVVRNVGPQAQDQLTQVGGRVLGRYWYDTNYGGTPNPL